MMKTAVELHNEGLFISAFSSETVAFSPSHVLCTGCSLCHAGVITQLTEGSWLFCTSVMKFPASTTLLQSEPLRTSLIASKVDQFDSGSVLVRWKYFHLKS